MKTTRWFDHQSVIPVFCPTLKICLDFKCRRAPADRYPFACDHFSRYSYTTKLNKIQTAECGIDPVYRGRAGKNRVRVVYKLVRTCN